MTKVASRRSSVHINIALRSPIFDWQGVPSQFFAMINDALPNDFNVTPGNFSAVSSNNLGELAARYSLFDGPSNIALFSDRLSMDFPVLQPGDFDLVQMIVERVFVAFRSTFPGYRYATVQANVAEHLEFFDGTNANDYMANYAVHDVEGAFKEIRVVQQPSVRFGVADANNAWHALCTAEKSELLPDGLYVVLNMTFREIDQGEVGYRTLYGLYMTIVRGCSTTLGLDWEDDA